MSDSSDDDAYVREFMDHRAWWLTSVNLLYSMKELWDGALRESGGVDHYAVEGGIHADVAAHPTYNGTPQPYKHEPVILLLAGYALETAVKAVLVKRLPPEQLLQITDTRPPKPYRWFTRHDLNGLFERADILRTMAERQFLDKLRSFIEWAGRYPATLGGTRDLSLTTLSRSDVDMALELFKSARTAYGRFEPSQ